MIGTDVLTISRLRKMKVKERDGRILQAGTVMQKNGLPKNTVVPCKSRYTREVLWSDAIEWADSLDVELIEDIEDPPQPLPSDWENERDGLRAAVGLRDETISKLKQTIRELTSSDIPAGLLKKHSILAGAKQIDVICGIYFLILKEEIVYIGQSINIISRVASHKRDKEFDSYSYVEVTKENLTLMEAAYINAYKPRLNGRFYPEIARMYHGWDGVPS